MIVWSSTSWTEVISNLLAGCLLFLRQDDVAGSKQRDDRQVELIRHWSWFSSASRRASSRTSSPKPAGSASEAGAGSFVTGVL